MQLQRSFTLILTALLSSISISQAQSVLGNLVTQGTNKCIGIQNGNFANGASQEIQTCNSTSPAQQWQFVDSNSVQGQQILQTSNGYCLDVPNGNGVDGQTLQIWQCSDSDPNQFFSTNGNQIVWNDSDMCLNVENGQQNDFANGTPLQLYSCSSSDPNSNIQSSLASILAPATLNSYGKPGLTSVFNQTRKRMLAWGYDNSQAPMMAAGSKIGSYYHWENNEIPNMPADVPYIPMYWGVTKTSQWNAVKQTIGSSVPGAVLGFNEPDVLTQSNMDPISAANLYYNQITKVYGTKGSNLISPPIVWNVEGWLEPFMNACEKLGCGISAIGYHQYISLAGDAGGSVDNAVALLKERVTNLYQKYKMPIILNELGLTQAGGGTSQQLNDFMVQSGQFLDNSPMVLAWALSAVFRKGDGWDDFLNSNLAFFNTDGSLSALGASYMNDVF